MTELHGWMAISETCSDEDKLTDSEMVDIMSRTISVAQKYGLKPEYHNGEPFINTILFTNHHTLETDDIITAYTEIARIATGSYGMIYLRDDEDAEHSNEFQIYVFKRGSCERRRDKLLSPCIPALEDKI